MNFFITIFNEVFHRPLLNALVFLTSVLPYHDLGFAVILLTILVRFALFPFTHHSIKAQAKMRELEPEIKKIREEHKDKQEEQARRIMALYKEHGVNPLSGCLMLLVQLPLLIALYQVFWKGVGPEALADLYSFVFAPDSMNTVFLGLVNLSERSIVIAVLAALTQYLQMRLAMPKQQQGREENKNDFSRIMTAQMTYMMPVVILIIGFQFPAAVGLYWTTMNVFAIIHEMMVRNKAKKLYGGQKREQQEQSEQGNKTNH